MGWANSQQGTRVGKLRVWHARVHADTETIGFALNGNKNTLSVSLIPDLSRICVALTHLSRTASQMETPDLQLDGPVYTQYRRAGGLGESRAVFEDGFEASLNGLQIALESDC